MASPAGEKWLDVFDTPYSNGANMAANGVFLGCICLSLVACVAIAWRKRRFIPFTFVLCVAYVFEILTYALRFQGWGFTTFTTQYGLATITPVFVTIAIHLATAEVIAVLGATHAPLSPAAYLRTFIWTDIATLCIQSLGLSLTFSGARAAGPWGLMLPARAHTGQTILFAGLVVHSLSLATALVVLATTYVRASKETHSYSAFQQRGSSSSTSAAPGVSPRCKLFLAALPLAAACVLVRCAYRAAAAWGGIGSPIAKDLLLWLVTEGALLTEALVSLAAFHPALCLDDTSGSRTQDLEAGRPAMVMDKRFSTGTMLSMADLPPSPEHAATVLHEPQSPPSRWGESRQLMFSSNVMAPSDAGSSDAGSSRRPSALLAEDPYYRYEDPFASPREEDSPYDTRFSEDITSERLSEEGDRFETESFVQPPRKSSKRMSRIVSPSASDRAMDLEEEDVVLSPPRKSSKRLSRQMPPTERGLSVREEEDERLEVASIVLPSRKPSKMSTMRGADDLDAVSLYSQ